MEKKSHNFFARHRGWIAAAFGLMAVAITLAAYSGGLSGDKREAQKECPFVTEKLLATPPIADQEATPLCWIYAMLRTIETDCLQEGDSVRLSPTYIARRLLEEQATQAYFAARQKSDTDLGMRGMATDCLVLMERYGAMPWQSYKPKEANYTALCRHIGGLAAMSMSLDEMQASLHRQLDEQLGYLPKAVFMLGMRYTTRQFAHSVCLPGQYEALTSFTHHPFGERFAVESPDNRCGVESMNLPIDTLLAITKRAVASGHAVCWEGDISEKGFRQDLGTATIKARRGMADAQKLRQSGWERGQTTDDHCLVIVGLAHDKTGKPYLIAHNSWGDTGPYHGAIYMSDDYFRLKTLLIVARRQ